MSQKKFCIIGLGYFGYNLALRLSEAGAEVLAVDHHQDRIDDLADRVTHAVCMDSKDAKALKSLNLQDMDAVIIAIGKDFNNSILTTSHIQEMGVTNIIARVTTPVHERLLKLMNVNEVLVPEAEAAQQLAKRLMISGVIGSMMISEDYGIYEVVAPEEFCGKKIVDINLRQKFSLNLVTIKRIKQDRGLMIKGELEEIEVAGIPKPDQEIQDGDILVLFGKESDMKKLLHQ